MSSFVIACRKLEGRQKANTTLKIHINICNSHPTNTELKIFKQSVTAKVKRNGLFLNLSYHYIESLQHNPKLIPFPHRAFKYDFIHFYDLPTF